jgi:hypothetical protein
MPQQPAGVGSAERLQRHSRCPVAGPVRHHESQRQRAEPRGEVSRERPGRRVGQVQVVEEQGERPVRGGAPEDGQQRALHRPVATGRASAGEQRGQST